MFVFAVRGVCGVCGWVDGCTCEKSEVIVGVPVKTPLV